MSSAQWVGLENFAFLFSDSRFLEAIQFTLLFVLVTVPVQYSLAFALALLVDQKLRGRIVFRLTYILPLAISSLIIGLMWRLLMHESSAGFINALMERLGIGTIRFFSNPDWARFAIFFVNIWSSVGSTMVFLLGGLQTIDVEQLEAATVDGANAWQRFFLIKLPLLRQISGLALIFMFVGTFGIFEKILASTCSPRRSVRAGRGAPRRPPGPRRGDGCGDVPGHRGLRPAVSAAGDVRARGGIDDGNPAPRTRSLACPAIGEDGQS
jgi:ABC-type sugar transport system permease subunit